MSCDIYKKRRIDPFGKIKKKLILKLETNNGVYPDDIRAFSFQRKYSFILD